MSAADRSPLVSVVVPCFNYGRYVAAAIQSALSQDWPALEVIAVDDGSTDDTPAVLRTFGSAIRVIERENGGVNAATDAGVAAARGELITFLDADDTWPAGRVRVLAETLLAHPEAGAVYGDMRVLDEDGGVVHASFNAHKGFPVAPSGRFLGQILAFNCVSAGAMMVRSALRDRFHPIPAHGGWHDWWIATQILREAEIVSIPEIVNNYRQHGRNQNMGADEERAVGLLRTELSFRRWVIAHTAPPLVGIGDLARALGALDWALARIARFDGVPVGAVAGDDRAAAQAALRDGRRLICAGEREAGLARVIAAAAQAPAWPDPRSVLSEATEVLSGDPATRATTGATVEAVPVRAVLDDPSLLSDWAAAHDAPAGGGPAPAPPTLAIFGVRDAALQDALVALVTRLGLADSGADLLVVGDSEPAILALRLGRAVRTISLPGDVDGAAGDDAAVESPAPPSAVRVSVVIPCFNYGRYLADAVESVLAGTLREIEIIIVDDGSTDDSREVARRLIGDHPEAAIQLVAQPNCGAPGQVRNVGIARARGEYILCLDADDMLHPGFLAACVAALDGAPAAAIAYADFQMFGEADTLQQPPPFWNARVECDCNFVGTASMFRRLAWEQAGGYETDLAMVGYEDWDFWVGCVEQGWSGLKAPGALWYYRVHGGSIYSTHVRRDQELKARIMLKHPSLYSDDQRRWARAILDGDPSASAIGARVGWMPVFMTAPAPAPAPATALPRPQARIPTPAPAAIDGARRTAVLAFADELIADPALLAGWGESFDGRDEVTLVIHAPDWTSEEAAAKLGPLVATAGLDGGDAADLLALASPASAETDARLAAGARAILSRRPVPAPFDGLQTVGGDGSLTRLRATLGV